MELTILGCESPYPGPGGACSSYLLTEGDQHVLLDCGSGALARLGQIISLHSSRLQAVVLSHLHPDHMSDFWLLRYALAYAVEQGLRPPLPVYLPAEPQETRRQLPYHGVELQTLQAGDELCLLGAKFRFFATQHPLPCHGVRMETASGTLCYTADTAYFPGLADHCRGADLLLSECSLRDQDGERRTRGHMTAGDVGRLAAEAGVRQLVLTHFWPEHDRQLLVQQAAAHCSCPVSAAAPGAKWTI